MIYQGRVKECIFNSNSPVTRTDIVGKTSLSYSSVDKAIRQLKRVDNIVELNHPIMDCRTRPIRWVKNPNLNPENEVIFSDNY